MEAGYDKLALFMGRYSKLAIFRQFATLNTKNLLYMQAELVSDEAELEDIVHDDKYSLDAEKQKHHISWTALKEPLANGKPCFQLRKVLEIREKLEKYSECY
jgi:hypothetical protein